MPCTSTLDTLQIYSGLGLSFSSISSSQIEELKNTTFPSITKNVPLSFSEQEKFNKLIKALLNTWKINYPSELDICSELYTEISSFLEKEDLFKDVSSCVSKNENIFNWMKMKKEDIEDTSGVNIYDCLRFNEIWIGC